MSQSDFITPKSEFRIAHITLADIATPTAIAIIITGFMNFLPYYPVAIMTPIARTKIITIVRMAVAINQSR